MKILILGSGGREHALAWKLAQSRSVSKLLCAPGNAGISQLAECVKLNSEDGAAVTAFAIANKVDLVVIGPEAPLCAGVADVLRNAGIKVFGPSQAAAELEGSKDFAKKFMQKYHIPTARAATFDLLDEAQKYIADEFANGEQSLVIKADGLAAGKGVLVAESEEEAMAFAEECFSGAFGESGNKILIEECLFGEEASIFAFTDGQTIVPLASTQDHKRAYDGDQGPNTGGMGAYSPAPVVDEKMDEFIAENILTPFLAGIKAEKLDYRGVIFVGIMVTSEGPKVLEFNVRFGDPEAQPLMRRFEGDLADVLYKIADSKLDQASFAWRDESAISVVIASGGYPGKYTKGFPITGIDNSEASGCVVFHAGTDFDAQGNLVNSGGRVLGVSALGETIKEAIQKAYVGVEKIHFQDSFYRKDIGARALNRNK